MGTLADWQIHERCKVGMVTPYDPALTCVWEATL